MVSRRECSSLFLADRISRSREYPVSRLTASGNFMRFSRDFVYPSWRLLRDLAKINVIIISTVNKYYQFDLWGYSFCGGAMLSELLIHQNSCTLYKCAIINYSFHGIYVNHDKAIYSLTCLLHRASSYFIGCLMLYSILCWRIVCFFEVYSKWITKSLELLFFVAMVLGSKIEIPGYSGTAYFYRFLFYCL